MLRFLIALIAFAIAIQNTCPYGYAGKTSVAAPHVHNCPLKVHQPAMPDGQKRVDKDFRDLNHPFVLIFAPSDGIFKTFAPVKETGIIRPAEYSDIFLNPPHRPPKS
jgi:hypothetical protein